MEVDSESDTDPLSDESNSSDEDISYDTESDSGTYSSSGSSSVDANPEEQPQMVVASSEESQSNSLEPQRAEAATLASEVAFLGGQGSSNEQNITREPNVSNEASCSSGPTRKRSRESTSPTRTKNTSMSNDEESMMCPICFEYWTTSGVHRLVSLKCGHLFGLSCIEKWIKQPKARCPQCNHLARKTDIRKIYARNLKVLDTTERDQALKDLAAEQEKRRHSEVEAASMRMKLALVTQECERYKQELIGHKNTIEQMRLSNKRTNRISNQPDNCYTQGLSSQASSKSSFILENTLDLCKDGGCRILAVSNLLPLMVASQPCTTPLFPSYGFKKISTMDFRQTEFVPVHQKALKDLAFHSHDSLVLSTALDKTVKITNVYTNSIVQSYKLEVDAWSCTWNRDDPSTFFVGLRNGNALQFDTRMTSTHLCQLPPSGKGHPVVAMQYLDKTQASTYGMSGPVSLQLSACTFFEQRTNNEFKVHPMPVEGTFTSLSLEPVTGHMLVSCRPSVHHPKVTHLLCELTVKNLSQEASVIDKCCSCNVVQCLEGGPFQTQLTRSRLLLNPANNSSVLICSGDENSKAVMIWDAGKSQCLSQLSASSPVLDLCSFRSDSAFCLGALTDKQLRIYRWKDA